MNPPPEHLDKGVVRPVAPPGTRPFIVIRSSTTRPSPPDTAVAASHRGSWFYIESNDARSKQGFMFLRTLIGMRLEDAAAGSGAPVLTVPVG